MLLQCYYIFTNYLRGRNNFILLVELERRIIIFRKIRKLLMHNFKRKTLNSQSQMHKLYFAHLSS